MCSLSPFEPSTQLRHTLSRGNSNRGSRRLEPAFICSRTHFLRAEPPSSDAVRISLSMSPFCEAACWRLEYLGGCERARFRAGDGERPRRFGEAEPRAVWLPPFWIFDNPMLMSRTWSFRRIAASISLLEDGLALLALYALKVAYTTSITSCR